MGVRSMVLLIAAMAGLLLFVVVGTGFAGGSIPEGPHVPDQVLVRFRPGTPRSEIARAHAATRGITRDEIWQIGVEVVGLPRGLSVARAINLYDRNPNVEFAEPDYYVEMARVPNDPSYRYWQMQLRCCVNAEMAWDVTVGDPSVMIAVLDTGVDFTHPDFQGRNLVRGWDFVDNDADPTDANGHGTSVTGVVGAATDNGLGVASVTWRNAVLVVRIGDYSGYATSSRMAQGVTYAADRGARAINLSYATPSYLGAVATAVDYAWSKGAVTVAGAGNSGTSTPHYPAALPKVVAVAGLAAPDELVYYSNYGSWVDLAAPCGARTLVMGGNIGNLGGTSMSAPHVTGLLGLVFSVNPGLTPQQAVDIVRQTATDIGAPGFDDRFGWGRIDMHRAVLAAANTQSTPPASDGTPPTVTLVAPSTGDILAGAATITAQVSDDTGVDAVELYINDELAGWVTGAPYEWTWDTTTYPDGQHVLEVVAYDLAGNSGDSAATVYVENTAAPTIVTETFAGKVGFTKQGVSQLHSVMVSAPGEIRASLTWGGKADLDLYLYSPTGALVASSETRHVPEEISFDASQVGAYTLKVVAASGKASYTLTVTHP